MKNKFEGHTPGPWHIKHQVHFDKLRLAITKEVGSKIGGVPMHIGIALVAVHRPIEQRGEPSQEEIANAELIRAAPELLKQRDELAASLLRLLEAFETDSIQEPHMTIRLSWETNGKSIAKARGALALLK